MLVSSLELFSVVKAKLRCIELVVALLLKQHIDEFLSGFLFRVLTRSNLLDSVHFQYLFFDELVYQARHDVIPVEKNVLKNGFEQI